MKILTAAALTAPAVALAVLAAAAPALAATPAPATLASAKTLVQSRIDGRLHTLTALKTAIDAATDLSGAHRSTLSALVSSDSSGLTTLRAKVGGETTVQAVRDDERTMVDSYRIYLLVEPKVRFTIASDAETADAARLQKVHDTLASAVSAAQAKGKDVSAEQAELTDMANQIAAVSSTLSGKVDGLLAVAPGPDGSAITAAVSPVRTAVHNARADLGKAVADAKQVRSQLS